jgi:hypothetical protein
MSSLLVQFSAGTRRRITVTRCCGTVGMPLRHLPPLLDPLLSRLLGYPSFCLGLEAYKPRIQMVHIQLQMVAAK